MKEEKVSDCEFVLGDANNMSTFSDDHFDIVTMFGVLSIFDDFKQSMNKCIRVTRSDGAIFVVGQFNDYLFG